MKTCALIQIRVKSQRLPGKALLNIDGVSVIKRIIQNLKQSKYLDEVVICTTIDENDDLLEEYAKASDIPIYRGDIENVLLRFYDAAVKFKADQIVRITGDCPMVSYEAVDFLMQSHLNAKAEYTLIEQGKTAIGSFPQIISFKALERLINFNIDFSYSEYMLYYFTHNPDVFNINVVPVSSQYISPEYRLTLDYPDDLNMFNALYKNLREKKLEINLSNALKTLKEYPSISKINAHLIEKYDNIYDNLMAKIDEACVINKKKS